MNEAESKRLLSFDALRGPVRPRLGDGRDGVLPVQQGALVAELRAAGWLFLYFLYRKNTFLKV